MGTGEGVAYDKLAPKHKADDTELRRILRPSHATSSIHSTYNAPTDLRSPDDVDGGGITRWPFGQGIGRITFLSNALS